MSEPTTTPVRVDSTLSKGLRVLEALAKSPSGQGVTALSKELDLTKSNTFRLLQTLCALGYARSTPDKRYVATLKTWQVGRHCVDNLNLREIARPEMQHLARETGETIYLAVPEGARVVYIDKIDSEKPIRSWNPVGGSAPMHCVGTGKAILAHEYARRRDLMQHHLSQHTERTLTTLAELDVDMAATLERGYAFDTGEFRERILSFGAPVLLADNQAAAALGVSLPDINLPDGDADRYGALVAECAASVSAKLRRA
ncbi:MAG: IclR family transcriptional regulator [Pseudomonadota bacterium]